MAAAAAEALPTPLVGHATCPLAHVMRLATRDDWNLIFDAWVEEMRHAPASRGMPDSVFFPNQRAFVRGVLRCAKTQVAVAPDDPKHIYGFVTYESADGEKAGTLHWIYVKSSYAGIGLARTMLRAALGAVPIRATQLSIKVATRLDAERRSNSPTVFARYGIVYDPYQLLREEFRETA